MLRNCPLPCRICRENPTLCSLRSRWMDHLPAVARSEHSCGITYIFCSLCSHERGWVMGGWVMGGWVMGGWAVAQEMCLKVLVNHLSVLSPAFLLNLREFLFSSSWVIQKTAHWFLKKRFNLYSYFVTFAAELPRLIPFCSLILKGKKKTALHSLFVCQIINHFNLVTLWRLFFCPCSMFAWSV